MVRTETAEGSMLLQWEGFSWWSWGAGWLISELWAYTRFANRWVVEVLEWLTRRDLTLYCIGKYEKDR